MPWVVWYEEGKGDLQLHENDMVFAAKGVKDEDAEGGFHWVAVGSQLSATLDTSGKTGSGPAPNRPTNEEHCSLNKNPSNDAEHPRVAAGTMNAANPTVPWVTWDEELGGVKQVFVSRLVGAGASAHFELVNSGAPISIGANDSTRPDITFSGNTPYVSWREDVGGGVVKGFTGHFVNPANPTFVLDQSEVPADADLAGGRPRADLVLLHRDAVQRRRRGLPGRSDGNAVLPVHERDEPARPVRKRLPARHADHRRRERRSAHPRRP